MNKITMSWARIQRAFLPIIYVGATQIWWAFYWPDYGWFNHPVGLCATMLLNVALFMCACALFLFPERYARFVYVKRRGAPAAQLIHRAMQYVSMLIGIAIVWSTGYLNMPFYAYVLLCVHTIIIMELMEWAGRTAHAERAVH